MHILETAVDACLFREEKSSIHALLHLATEMAILVLGVSPLVCLLTVQISRIERCIHSSMLQFEILLPTI